MRIARRFVISGRVQGVGFRWFARDAAMREGVAGWVANLPDGRVEAFVEGAQEHPGSWWPDWLAWLEGLGGDKVPARGKRVPGGKGDKVLEDAPGRYVAMR